MAQVASYRLFDVRLLHKKMLSPSLMSCIFTGEQVRQMKMDGPDQRIKILFPSLNGTTRLLNAESSWWLQLQQLPPEERPIVRTYTLRNVNAEEARMEVEFVVHGTEGPASAWAISATPGDVLQMVAPNRAHLADSGGYEWKPHAGVEHALIIADETALPAVKNIMRQMAKLNTPPKLQVFLEVPARADCLALNEFGFAEVYCLPRDKLQSPHGEALLNAVKEHVFLPSYALSSHQEFIDETGQEVLWCGAEDKNNRFYGWVAAESSAVKHLRRYLAGERHVANEAISFMAYWSKGRE